MPPRTRLSGKPSSARGEVQQFPSNRLHLPNEFRLRIHGTVRHFGYMDKFGTQPIDVFGLLTNPFRRAF
jgi:hypothetical protein